MDEAKRKLRHNLFQVGKKYYWSIPLIAFRKLNQIGTIIIINLRFFYE